MRSLYGFSDVIFFTYQHFKYQESEKICVIEQI